MQFFQRTSKMAYVCENLGIINKVWYLYLLRSLENNYLRGIYIFINNDIIQGELFTIKLLSCSFCHPLHRQLQLLLNLLSSKIISFSFFIFCTAQFQSFLSKQYSGPSLERPPNGYRLSGLSRGVVFQKILFLVMPEKYCTINYQFVILFKNSSGYH